MKALTPTETGRLYDAIAEWWDAGQDARTIGLNYVRRTIELAGAQDHGRAGAGRHALDVGCGSGGRVIHALLNAGFGVTGIDVSAAMLERARTRHPRAELVTGDITEWSASRTYDVIVAWDSIFHLPRASQRPVVEKLCDALATGGALLFTAGGIAGEITGEMQGRTFYYSSLTAEEYLAILASRGCVCVLMERDQHPEQHVVFIAVKPGA